MSDERRSRAVAMLILATPCWGLSFPVMKALALEQQALIPGGTSWFFTALGVCLRFTSAGILLLPILFYLRQKISQREFEQGIILAIFGGIGILFQMDGLAYTAASTSAFLTQGYCVYIPIWMALRLRHSPTRKTMFCVALVIIGTAILANLDPRALKLGRGEIETIISSFFFTAQILTLEHSRYTANRPLPFSIVMFFAMGVLSLPVIMATAPHVSACMQAYASWPTIGYMAILVVICTLTAYMIMNHWQSHVTATEAGLIYCLEPVFASTFALFLPGIFSAWTTISYPNEQITARLLVGGALITAANVLLQFKRQVN